MSKSEMLVGAAIGAAVVTMIFAIILISPTSITKSEINTSDKSIPSIPQNTAPAYSTNLSLIDIFEIILLFYEFVLIICE